MSLLTAQIEYICHHCYAYFSYIDIESVAWQLQRTVAVSRGGWLVTMVTDL